MAQILLVEDDPAVLDLFFKILEAAGHTVVSADDGDTAYDLAATGGWAADLVISDLKMPRLDGYDLLCKLRALPTYETVPFLLITGLPDDSRVSDILELPHTVLRAKPLHAPDLRAAVADLIANRSTGDDEGAASVPPYEERSQQEGSTAVG